MKIIETIIQEFKDIRDSHKQMTGWNLATTTGVFIGAIIILLLPFSHQFLESITVEALIGIISILTIITIPLAILLVQDNASEKFVLDKQTKIEKIFNVRGLIAILITMIVPTILFWNHLSDHRIQSIFLILFGFGVWIIIYIMISIYRGLTNSDITEFMLKKRLDYIKELQYVQKKYAWPKIWKDTSGRKLIGDEKLMPLFLEYLEEIVQKTKKGEIEQGEEKFVLDEFIGRLENIDLRNPNTHKPLMDFTIRGESMNTDYESGLYTNAFQEIFRRLLINIMYISMKDLLLSSMLFKHIQNFDWSNKDLDKKIFIKTMTHNFFWYMKSYNPHDISNACDKLPSDWKITVQNLNNPDNDFVWHFFDKYKDWVIHDCYIPIERGMEFVNDAVNSCTKYLIPGIDISVWSTLFTFQFIRINKNWNKEEIIQTRAEKFIQTDEKFGLDISPIQNDGEKLNEISEEISKDERIEGIFHINEITNLFPILLDKEEVHKYIGVFQQLQKQYESNQKERYKIARIVNILKLALNWLKKNNEQTTLI